MYENRKYVIFNVSELYKIDFTQVLETTINTISKSVDGNMALIKWDGEIPECISSLTTIVGIYTYDEILIILSTEEWINYKI